MLFNSYAFLFMFLPLALAGYYLAARLWGAGAARVWLCSASLVFYGWWNPWFVLLLMGSIAFNYSVSRCLSGKAPGQDWQSLLLFAAVCANVLLLFYFKYLFALLAFFHQLGWRAMDSGPVALPLGISFFTFTQIGYLVDCRQKQISDHSFLNYVLFVTFFPHLIAGPILHHGEIMPQFARAETYRLKSRHLAIGLTLFAVGLAKKVLLADSLATSVDTLFADTHHLSLPAAWYAAVGWSMQLYFDFSGYSDMAIGLGILFAIHLPLNFNSPYQSRSIIDFWQRWHMSLTRYVTLLVYNPLAVWVARRRQRAGLPMSRRAAVTAGGFLALIAFPMFTTVLVAGVWHGAGLTYLVFGALHGCYLVLNHAWRVFCRPVRGVDSRADGLLAAAWRLALTYAAVLLAQLVFRAPNLNAALALVADMAGVARTAAAPLQQPLSHYALLLALVLIAFGLPNVYCILGAHSPALTVIRPRARGSLTWRPSWQFATLTGLLLALSVLLSQREVQFLYFQF